jgi:hypothetical protein
VLVQVGWGKVAEHLVGSDPLPQCAVQRPVHAHLPSRLLHSLLLPSRGVLSLFLCLTPDIRYRIYLVQYLHSITTYNNPCCPKYAAAREPRARPHHCLSRSASSAAQRLQRAIPRLSSRAYHPKSRETRASPVAACRAWILPSRRNSQAGAPKATRHRRSLQPST